MKGENATQKTVFLQRQPGGCSHHILLGNAHFKKAPDKGKQRKHTGGPATSGSNTNIPLSFATVISSSANASCKFAFMSPPVPLYFSVNFNFQNLISLYKITSKTHGHFDEFFCEIIKNMLSLCIKLAIGPNLQGLG